MRDWRAGELPGAGQKRDQFPERFTRKLVLEIWCASRNQAIGGSGTDFPRTTTLRPSNRTYDCLIGEKIWDQRQWMFDIRKR